MHELKFIGTGSAFNTQLGNNSAYIKQGNSLLLIDCGGTVFKRIQDLKILDGVKNLYIVITHTHPDHVGSLGDLIFYVYYMLHIKADIFFPDGKLMRDFLSNIGVEKELYCLNSSNKFEINNTDFGKIHTEFIAVPHVNTIPTYGFIININNENFYYSGDSSDISDEIINKLYNSEIQKIYHDTCGLDYEGNAHTPIRKLKEKIKPDFRNKVYCMHLDTSITLKEIKQSGFNAAQRE